MLRGQASEYKGFPWLCPLAPSLIPLDTSLIRTLQGHTSWVGAVALSSDGRRAVSGSDDNALRVWDLKDGKELVTFTVDANVSACALAQNNRTIVAGDSFGQVHFLRLEGVDLIHRLISSELQKTKNMKRQKGRDVARL